ncbi:MAG: 50S ribosomal protein L30 [Bacteroidetes bacterium]|nr:50S ribosomal protein L30 [Bacteroidota bacterium]HNR21371.1 50S ribosomal protein L30 [Bacteroidia bacterium]HNU34158.1 50S ribosomal protein L30 [Bacteroidia bacterium]
MGKIKVKLVKSGIDQSKRQKNTLEAMGFRKLHQVVEMNDNPAMRGMIEKVKHLVTVQE